MSCDEDAVELANFLHKHQQDVEVGVLTLEAPCALCGRTAPLRQATRDDTMTCPGCWSEYESACDEEDYYYYGAGRDAEVVRQAAQPPAPGQLLPWLLLVAQWGRDVRGGD